MDNYPYRTQKGECQSESKKTVADDAKSKRYIGIHTGNANQMKSVLETGPLTAQIQVQ